MERGSFRVDQADPSICLLSDVMQTAGPSIPHLSEGRQSGRKAETNQLKPEQEKDNIS